MSDKITSIDLLFDPELFHLGDALYQNQAVIRLDKVNSALFTALVREGRTYEVELMKPLTTQQRFTCECVFFNNNKVCKHVIAALIHFEKNKVAYSGKKKKPSRQRAKQVTMKSLLREVKDDELRAFVHHYARKDKSFADALKINFIRKLSLEDDARKYKLILDNIVPPVSSKEEKVKATRLKNFQKVAFDLLEQAQDTLAMNDFVETFYIVHPVLTKTHYILHYQPDALPVLEDVIKTAYIVYSELLDQKKAALELKKEMEAALFDLLESSYYHHCFDLFNVGELLYSYFSDAKTRLEEALLETTHASSSAEFEKAVAFSLLMRMHYHRKPKAFKPPPSMAPSAEEVVRILLQQGEDEVAHSILLHFHRAFPNDFFYAAKLLDLYQSKGNNAQFVQSAVEAFRTSGDLRLIDYVFRIADDVLVTAFREGMKEIKPTALSLSGQAAYYHKLGDSDRLMRFMYEVKDLRLVMKYDRWLNGHFPTELGDLYVQLVDEYLCQFVGEHAQIFIRELLDHLVRQKLTRIHKKILALILEKYSHRTALIDQMS